MSEDFETTMPAKSTNPTAEVAAAQSHLAIKLLDAISDPQLDRATRARHLSELAETLKRIAAAADSLAAAGVRSDEKPDNAPALCAHCLHMLSMTPAQLAQYIDQAAQRAVWSGWKADEFKEKIGSKMQLGDEIMFITVGAVNVRRASGEIATLYRYSG